VADERDRVEGGRDWFVGRVGPLLVMYAARKLDAPNFERYLELLAHHIDSIPTQQRIGALYEVLEPSSVDADRRRRVGQLLSARRGKLMQICVGCAYVSRSAVGRGILTALGWIVSPPFPMKTFDSLEPGLQWLKTQLPELDLAHSYQKYTSLRTRHLSSAHEPGRTR
jgi:hypothetical protein